jgi:hypothetical protein
VVITATKSSAATPGKVIASVKPTDASLSIPKAGAANRSTSETATAAAHRTPSETAAAAHRTTTTVHPAAAATVATTTTATLSHCWRSKRESEHQCCRSNRLEFTHRISPLLERQNSLLKLETF